MRETATNHELLDAWKTGDELAAQVLFDRYLARLTALARSRLSRKLARRLDPEDIVLSAWRSFFVAAGNGRVDVPEDDNLWPLLVTLTLRKLSRQTARQQADRRSTDRELTADMMEDVLARDPTPEQAAILNDELESLLGVLDESQREILTRRLRGETQREIAHARGCSERSVRRAIQGVRELIEQRQSDTPPTLATASPKRAGGRAPLPRAAIDADFTSDISDTDLIVHEMVGQGGFGRVYRATRKSTGSFVAVKFLKKRFWSDARALRGLMNEVDAARRIQHAHIRAVLDTGRTRRGVPFLVMDWVDGEDLAAWNTREQPGVNQIIQSLIPVAEAVAAAHARGVLHCDLKPTNVLRRADGYVFLTDFGFARGAADSSPNAMGGTAGFLAPEQISSAFGEIGPHTDVYGFGALLYCLLTGQPPFVGRDVPETLALILSSQPANRPVVLNREIAINPSDLCATCLSKDPMLRMATADEVARALRSMS